MIVIASSLKTRFGAPEPLVTFGPSSTRPAQIWPLLACSENKLTSLAASKAAAKVPRYSPHEGELSRPAAAIGRPSVTSKHGDALHSAANHMLVLWCSEQQPQAVRGVSRRKLLQCGLPAQRLEGWAQDLVHRQQGHRCDASARSACQYAGAPAARATRATRASAGRHARLGRGARRALTG